MKKIINTLYDRLIAWVEIVAEYRQSQSRKYY